MKKEYIIYKLSEEMKNATRIENELFKKFDVKRGLRNEDGRCFGRVDQDRQCSRV